MFQAVTELIWRQVFLSYTALRTQNLIHGLNQENWIFLFVLLFHIHYSVFSGVMHGISSVITVLTIWRQNNAKAEDSV